MTDTNDPLELEPCAVELRALGPEGPRVFPGYRSGCGNWYAFDTLTRMRALDNADLSDEQRVQLAGSPLLADDERIALIPLEFEPAELDRAEWVRRLPPGTRIRFRRAFQALEGHVVQENELGTVIHARPDELLVHVDDELVAPGDGLARTEWNSLACWSPAMMHRAPFDVCVALARPGDVRRLMIDAWNGNLDVEVRTVGVAEKRTTRVHVNSCRKKTGEPVPASIWQAAIAARQDVLLAAITEQLEASELPAVIPTGAEAILLELQRSAELTLDALAARLCLEANDVLALITPLLEAGQVVEYPMEGEGLYCIPEQRPSHEPHPFSAS